MSLLKKVKGIYDVCRDTSKSAEKVKAPTVLAAGFICVNRIVLKGVSISNSSGEFSFSTRVPGTILAGLDFHIRALILYLDKKCPLYSIYCALNEVEVLRRKWCVTEAQRQEGGTRFQPHVQALIFTSFFETLLLSLQPDNSIFHRVRRMGLMTAALSAL